MRRKKNLFSAFSSHVRVCAFINHLKGISFDDDSDEDADWKKQSLVEAEVRAYFYFLSSSWQYKGRARLPKRMNFGKISKIEGGGTVL